MRFPASTRQNPLKISTLRYDLARRVPAANCVHHCVWDHRRLGSTLSSLSASPVPTIGHQLTKTDWALLTEYAKAVVNCHHPIPAVKWLHQLRQIRVDPHLFRIPQQQNPTKLHRLYPAKQEACENPNTNTGTTWYEPLSNDHWGTHNNKIWCYLNRSHHHHHVYIEHTAASCLHLIFVCYLSVCTEASSRVHS